MSIFAVTAGKGGVGKSCVAAYTAAALADSGSNVLLIELGADSRSLDLILGCASGVLYDVFDLSAGRCELSDAVLTVGQGRLHLLPGPPFSLKGGRNPADTAELVRRCAGQFDHLVLDGVDFASLPPRLPDTILLVTAPHALSVRAASLHASELYGAGARTVRLVINKVPPQIQPIPGVEDFDDLIDLTGAQLAAVIPHSPKLQYASGNGRPLGRDTITYKVFDNLAARLRGIHRPLLVR